MKRYDVIMWTIAVVIYVVAMVRPGMHYGLGTIATMAVFCVPLIAFMLYALLFLVAQIVEWYTRWIHPDR